MASEIVGMGEGVVIPWIIVGRWREVEANYLGKVRELTFDHYVYDKEIQMQ
jgi:hypothetical protein